MEQKKIRVTFNYGSNNNNNNHHLLASLLYILYQAWSETGIISCYPYKTPILQMRKLRLIEMKDPTEDYKDGEKGNLEWTLTLGLLTSLPSNIQQNGKEA